MDKKEKIKMSSVSRVFLILTIISSISLLILLLISLLPLLIASLGYILTLGSTSNDIREFLETFEFLLVLIGIDFISIISFLSLFIYNRKKDKKLAMKPKPITNFQEFENQSVNISSINSQCEKDNL